MTVAGISLANELIIAVLIVGTAAWVNPKSQSANCHGALEPLEFTHLVGLCRE